MGQLPQLVSRLFPFTRGLNHAYWAPNVWALVTATDRVLLRCKCFAISEDQPNILLDVKRMEWNVPLNISGIASTSRGLVGDTVFAVLPTIQPIHTFIITLFFQSVGHYYLFGERPILSYHRCQICLAKLWMTPTYKSFLTALTLCGYSSFLFGWHVHEKAVLLVLVPLRFVFQVNTAA